MPADIAPGTHGRNRLDGTDEPPITALYTTLTSCNDVGAEGDFQSIDGILTFSGTGTVWTGTIQANMATRFAKDDILVVQGSFTGIPML